METKHSLSLKPVFAPHDFHLFFSEVLHYIPTVQLYIKK